MGANDPPDMDDVGMKATLDGRRIHRVYDYFGEFGRAIRSREPGQSEPGSQRG